MTSFFLKREDWYVITQDVTESQNSISFYMTIIEHDWSQKVKFYSCHVQLRNSYVFIFEFYLVGRLRKQEFMFSHKLRDASTANFDRFATKQTPNYQYIKQYETLLERHTYNYSVSTGLDIL